MTLHLPDLPAATWMTEAELRLELACALYAHGKATKVSGAEVAGSCRISAGCRRRNCCESFSRRCGFRPRRRQAASYPRS